MARLGVIGEGICVVRESAESLLTSWGVWGVRERLEEQLEDLDCKGSLADGASLSFRSETSRPVEFFSSIMIAL